MNRSSRFNPLHLLSFLLISLAVLLWSPGVFAAGLLAGRGTHSLAISPGNAFGYAWGANRDGQMGNEETGRNQPYPSRWSPFAAADSSVSVLATDDAPVQVASGDWHSLALRSDGTVWAWGNNSYRQLGNNSADESHVPTPVVTVVERSDGGLDFPAADGRGGGGDQRSA
ncbi:MAG: hypothetical protein H6973_17635 [Gammaproteobacteria bacterium]|nr:hypothetical protein [Gammaproteobacteria bacterium]HRX70567.1 hypothetical protein [Candidatus Competibacteraceae bacterium]